MKYFFYKTKDPVNCRETTGCRTARQCRAHRVVKGWLCLTWRLWNSTTSTTFVRKLHSTLIEVLPEETFFVVYDLHVQVHHDLEELALTYSSVYSFIFSRTCYYSKYCMHHLQDVCS